MSVQQNENKNSTAMALTCTPPVAAVAALSWQEEAWDSGRWEEKRRRRRRRRGRGRGRRTGSVEHLPASVRENTSKLNTLSTYMYTCTSVRAL